MRVVKIKTWNRMEQEYGLDKNNHFINMETTFHKNMEEIMPKNRIIKIEKDELDYDIWKGYIITKFMIEEELDSKDYPQYFI